MPKLTQVIESQDVLGDGKSTPVRRKKAYYDIKGNLLARNCEYELVEVKALIGDILAAMDNQKKTLMTTLQFEDKCKQVMELVNEALLK